VQAEGIVGGAIKQANFSLPEDLLEELRKVVPKGEQSKVVCEALRNELNRIRFKRALQTSFGTWKPGSHPELSQGSRRFVRALRKSHRPRPSEKQ
jgi:hypothetical protein